MDQLPAEHASSSDDARTAHGATHPPILVESAPAAAGSKRKGSKSKRKSKRKRKPAQENQKELTINKLQTEGRGIENIVNNRVECSGIKTPAMLPPMPDQERVDVLTVTEAESKSSPFPQRQRSYEDECKVYRALEKLPVNHGTLVLHNFGYTQKQSALFVPISERQHDFLVFVKGAAVVALEVKKMDAESNSSFQRNYKSAIGQLEALETLINGIADKCKEPRPKIFMLSAFPSLAKDTACQFKYYNESLTPQQKDNILLKDDLDALGDSEMFPRWWKKNVTDMLPSASQSEQRTRHECHAQDTEFTTAELTLIGLWGVDANGKFETNKSRLPYWIKKVDKEIKDSVITSAERLNKTEPYSENIVSVIKFSDEEERKIFQDCLKIKYLRKEQQEVYNKSRVFLNAPAGAGKTLLVQAKILHLIKSSTTSEKIVVFMFGENASEEYRDVLRHAGVSVELLQYSEKINPALDLVTVVQETDFSVVLVYARVIDRDEIQWTMHTLASLRDTNSHIFLDDVQKLLWSVVYDDVLDNTDYCSTIVNTISEVLAGSAATTERVVWVVSDVMQCFMYRTTFTTKQVAKLMNVLSQLPHLFIETLSANLRNSTDIAALLTQIRCSYITRFNAALPSDTPADMDRFLPKQIEGHRIHGSIPSLYILNKDRVTSSIPNICKSALQELFTPPCSLNPSDLAIITLSYSALSELPTLLEAGLGDIPYTTAATRAAGSDTGATRANNNSVWTGDVYDTLSLEWPAAIVVFYLTDTYMYEDWDEELEQQELLSWLYLAVSRARVHCNIVIVYRDGSSRGLARYFRDLCKQHVIVRQDDLLGEDDEL